MKETIINIGKELTKIVIIVTAVLYGFTIIFPKRELNLTQESIKSIDSLIKATKVCTSS